jgi:hypothetical protein
MDKYPVRFVEQIKGVDNEAKKGPPGRITV